MTALALPVPSAFNLSSSTLPSLSAIAETAALGTLDTAGRVVETVERSIDLTAQSVNVALPAVNRFIGGFLIPAHGNAILGSVLDYATPLLTGFVAGATKATVQMFSFGAPAWIETLREGYAVSAVSGQLNHGDTSREFLARSFAENTSEPLIKDSLLKYLDVRKELSKLQQEPSEATQERIQELSRNIARFEIKLRDYQDFSSLKLILERGEEFVEEQQKRINQLARSTADNIIGRVEGFYREKCGSFAGKVEASWNAADTEEKRTELRAALTDKIALRLQNIFEKEMNADETVAQLNRVAGDLHSSFGTYQNALRSTLYTVLGVGYASGAFSYLADAAGRALWDMAGGVLDGIKESYLGAVRSLNESINSGLRGCYNYFYSMFAEATNEIINNNPAIAALRRGSEAVVNGATAVHNAAESGVSAISNAAEQARAAVSGVIDSGTSYFENATESINDAVTGVFGGPGSPGYSQSHWSGTNEVLMGYGSDGTPYYGESCISGLPSRPSFDAHGLDVSRFGETLKDSSSLTELLTPRQGLAPDSEEMKKLVEFLLEKK